MPEKTYIYSCLAVYYQIRVSVHVGSRSRTEIGEGQSSLPFGFCVRKYRERAENTHSDDCEVHVMIAHFGAS